ncbi:hypothetical protein GCM10025734_29530 [Kitasatospora paranensis]|uniref:tetratricopeptide repeat protein n=1 Tax=Kitasatospora paranensis TaxID=258053 RepID=UPI0031E74214
MGPGRQWQLGRAQRRYERGMQLAKEQKWAESEAALRSVTETRTAALGPDHQDTLRSRGQRAAVLRRLDRTDEAVAELNTCVEALGRTLGESARPTLEMRVLRCQVLRKADRGAAAMPDARFVTQALDSRPDELNFQASGLLGGILNDLGRHEEASEAFASQASVFDGLTGSLRLAAQQLRANHATTALYLGRFEQVEAVSRGMIASIGTLALRSPPRCALRRRTVWRSPCTARAGTRRPSRSHGMRWRTSPGSAWTGSAAPSG